MGTNCFQILAQFSGGTDTPTVLLWIAAAVLVVLFVVIIDRLSVRRRKMKSPRRPIAPTGPTLSQRLDQPFPSQPQRAAPAQTQLPATPAPKPPQKLDLNP